jgi:FkbM family methyltransferase
MSIRLQPISPLNQFLLNTRFVRIFGRKLVKVFKAKLPNGDLIFVRPTGNDEEVVNEVFAKNIYEKYHRLRDSDNVVDVGANIGCFSLKACREVGNKGKVISLEPATSNFKLLAMNIAVNRYNRICTMLKVALGSTTGTALLKIYKKGGANTFLERNDGQKATCYEHVEVRSLDSIISQFRTRVDFLKIDVEGYEMEVLRGSSKILSDYHPVIVLEAHSFGPSPEEIASYLSNWGYSSRIERYSKMTSLMYAS